MNGWDATRIAAVSGAELVREPTAAGGPRGVSIDSRRTAPGDLFAGLPGEREDGGVHAPGALGRGAWGVLVRPEHAGAALAAGSGAVLSHAEPLTALQRLAAEWRLELGAHVIAVTGSTGKTSTKDILAAMLGAAMPTAATPGNLNTEIGLPLAVLAAPEGTRALVLEMAMRGPGQIAELTALAAPDVGVIVNVGPAHLELLGSLENIAAAKAELIAGLAPGSAAVVPAGDPLLAPHLRADLRTLTFGEGGDVTLAGRGDDGTVLIDHDGERIELRPSFDQQHNLSNLLAAVAAARAIGHTPGGRLEVEFSAMRGGREPLPGGLLLIDDCYNANPMSMRAAIEDLARTAPGRRVAVLGDMLELGPRGPELHREVGALARRAGIEELLAVGPLGAEIAAGYGSGAATAPDAPAAAAALPDLLRSGDTVLLKASRGVGLERAAEAVRQAAARSAGGGEDPDELPAPSSPAGPAPGRR